MCGKQTHHVVVVLKHTRSLGLHHLTSTAIIGSVPLSIRQLIHFLNQLRCIVSRCPSFATPSTPCASVSSGAVLPVSILLREYAFRGPSSVGTRVATAPQAVWGESHGRPGGAWLGQHTYITHSTGSPAHTLWPRALGRRPRPRRHQGMAPCQQQPPSTSTERHQPVFDHCA